jgi:hypothetical protein
VSHLKKYLKAPMDVVLPEVTPLEADFTYPEHPIKILDKKRLCHKVQDGQVLQDTMKLSYGRGSYIGK